MKMRRYSQQSTSNQILTPASFNRLFTFADVSADNRQCKQTIKCGQRRPETFPSTGSSLRRLAVVPTLSPFSTSNSHTRLG